MRTGKSTSADGGALVSQRDLHALGLRTRVLEAGGTGEEAVVFVHGGPGSANDWDHLLPSVGAFSRSVAFDLPGFGKAERPADWRYSPNELATFVAAVFGQLEIRRAHMVANDLGGNAALTWAAAHPACFASKRRLPTSSEP